MKAIVLRNFGGPENLRLEELPDPRPGPGEVLVQVTASSVNPIDTKIRAGAVPALSPELPAVLHGDVAGQILAVGAGVTGWREGDCIFALGGGFKGSAGALAEQMCIDARLLAKAPAKLSDAQTAALPVVGLTAWQAVVERAQVRPGQRVLIHGGSGGVGHIAVQLARTAGAHVTATVSTEEKAAVARELGAHEVHLGREVAECTFDAVIDTLGGENLGRSLTQIGIGGTVVSIAGRTTADLSPLHANGGTLHIVFVALPLLTGHNRETLAAQLSQLGRLVELGELRPTLAETFCFTEAAEAHATLEAGKHIGKIALSGW
ncbi:MAG: zinc-binding dehydrogenase [Opitutales bacterium]